MKIWDNLVVVIENMFLHTHTHSALFWSKIPQCCSAPLPPTPVFSVCSNYLFTLTCFPLSHCVAQKSNVPLFFVFFPLSLSLVGGVYLRLLRGQAYF